MKRKGDIIELSNGVEANLLEALLKEEEIPHYIRSYGDPAYDGIFQLQKGWGTVESPREYLPRIREILNGLRERSL